jgi:hypothetical protein
VESEAGGGVVGADGRDGDGCCPGRGNGAGVCANAQIDSVANAVARNQRVSSVRTIRLL